MSDLFGAVAVSLEAQIAELEREMALRRRVYPCWVVRQMSHAAMTRQMNAMDAALATLRRVRQMRVAGLVS